MSPATVPDAAAGMPVSCVKKTRRPAAGWDSGWPDVNIAYRMNRTSGRSIDHGRRASNTGVQPLPLASAALDMPIHDSAEPWNVPAVG